MNADDRMLADHQRMWHDFCRLMKYALVGAVIVPQPSCSISPPRAELEPKSRVAST